MDEQAAAVTVGWVAPVIQLASSGGFTAIVWYLLVKYIPSIEERHTKERDRWRKVLEKAYGINSRNEEE